MMRDVLAIMAAYYMSIFIGVGILLCIVWCAIKVIRNIRFERERKEIAEILRKYTEDKK